MCGIAGFFAPAGTGAQDEATLRSMICAIQHRGPDDEGIWCDHPSGIALGHRRLSIIDVSPLGHQPMESATGRYVVVFNGEFYNFSDVKQELESLGRSFRSRSDTEVFLTAVEQWGVVPAVKKLAGMFSLALWDRKERRLHLIRDRLGEKPLYYAWFGGTLLFGSELKALRIHPAWRGEIDRDSLALYLRHAYIPAPYTIYRNVHKAQPGKVLSFSADCGGRPEEETYWSARETARYGLENPFSGSDDEIVHACDSALRRTIAQEMVSDVPLGAFLSGGIDSSLVVALMQAQSDARIRTFTIGFREKEYNEAKHAKAVASHLGTDHTEMYVAPEDSLNVIPKLPAMYDEPFADSSQIPTFLVSQLARQHVTVSLSGDGGDEIFGGYNRYFWGSRIWKKLKPVPAFFRRSIATALTFVGTEDWDKMYHAVSGAIPGRYRLRTPGDRVHKLAGMLESENPEALYGRLTSIWQDPLDVALDAREPLTALTDTRRRLDSASFVEQMMYLDTVSYLPDDILVKVDRASMAVSLESRAPFLDHRIVEFAWRVPLSMKIRNGQGKWILRQVLDRYIPRELIERPKMGFGVPIDHWLRGPLREWAGDLLSPERIRREGFFDPAAIQKKWNEHQNGTRNWQYPLWTILVFQAWLEAQSVASRGQLLTHNTEH